MNTGEVPKKQKEKLIPILFRILTVLVCLIIIPVYGLSAFAELRRITDPIEGNVFWFLLGGLVGWIIFILRPVSFLRVSWLHELSHSLMGWLLGAQVKAIGASQRNGGLTTYDYPYRWGIELIALAPYILQIIPLLLVAIMAIAQPVFHPYLSLCIGLAWVSFYFDMWMTLRIPQTDIIKSGRFFSWVVIVAFNILISCVVLTAVARECRVSRFLWTGVPLELWHHLLNWIR